MIKNNAVRRILIASLSLFVLLFIYFFPSEEELLYTTSSEYISAIQMPIYVLDENNYVSRVTVLKNSEDVLDNVKYIITTLTEGTTESEYLSNGFIPIIPENTTITSLSLDDGLLKINFSIDILNISLENEEKLIESIVFSLCEFSEIEEIMIFVDGERLVSLPNSNKELPVTLDKSYGINKLYDITSFKNTTSTTSYYLSKTTSGDYYYIPITKIENSDDEKIEIIIKNLQTSPINQTNLISYLKASATLEYYEILEESIILSFNNELIADLSSEEILEEVQYSIYLSVRDSYDVTQVIFESSSEIKVSVFY